MIGIGTRGFWTCGSFGTAKNEDVITETRILSGNQPFLSPSRALVFKIEIPGDRLVDGFLPDLVD